MSSPVQSPKVGEAPQSSTSNINIPTPPSSSHSDNANPSPFARLAPRDPRRRGSADSWNSDASPAYSLTSRTGQFHFATSPGAQLIIRSGSSPYAQRKSSVGSNAEDIDHLDINTPTSAGQQSTTKKPPSRQNSRDYSLDSETGEQKIQLHMMPKDMILPLPDRIMEMKSLLDFNKELMRLIKNAIGEETYDQCLDLWCHTRRSEISDLEFLRRSKYFIVERNHNDVRLWSEFCLMVGFDHSVDLTKDDNGNFSKVSDYADKIGHMQSLGEEEEEE